MTELGYLGLPNLDVAVARSVEDAVRMIEREGYTVMAGGTYLLSSITMGVNKARKLLDISNLDDLSFIRESPDIVEAGALTTHNQLVEKLGDRIPALKSFWRCYSSPVVSNRATLGGSIMLKNCSEDIIPIMLALDAELVFQTGRGEQRSQLHEFLQQRSTQPMLLKSVVFAKKPNCMFEKLWLGVSRIPIMSVALSFVQQDGRLEEVRVAVSHHSLNLPNRVYPVERFLQGRTLDRQTAVKASQLMAQSINPSHDVVAPAWYRREAAGVLLGRLLTGAGG